MAELHRPGFTIDEGLWTGLSWGIGDIEGVRVLQHSGNTNNYSSQMWLLPESGWGFVLLLNADSQFNRRAVLAMGEGVTALLLGQEPQPATLSPITSLLYGVLLSVALLELIGIMGGVRTLRRWRMAQPTRNLGRQIFLPLAGHVLVALLFLVVVPAQLPGGSLQHLLVIVPDLGYTLGIVGALALGWGLLRTGLALRLLRQPTTHIKQPAHMPT